MDNQPTQCGVGKCATKTVVMVQYEPDLNVTRGVCKKHAQQARVLKGWYVIWEEGGKWMQ